MYLLRRRKKLTTASKTKTIMISTLVSCITHSLTPQSFNKLNKRMILNQIKKGSPLSKTQLIIISRSTWSLAVKRWWQYLKIVKTQFHIKLHKRCGAYLQTPKKSPKRYFTFCLGKQITLTTNLKKLLKIWNFKSF